MYTWWTALWFEYFYFHKSHIKDHERYKRNIPFVRNIWAVSSEKCSSFSWYMCTAIHFCKEVYLDHRWFIVPQMQPPPMHTRWSDDIQGSPWGPSIFQYWVTMRYFSGFLNFMACNGIKSLNVKLDNHSNNSIHSIYRQITITILIDRLVLEQVRYVLYGMYLILLLEASEYGS